MKKFFYSFLLFFLCTSLYCQEKTISVNKTNFLEIIIDFLQNPFLNKQNYPSYFNTIEDFTNFYSNSSITKEDIYTKNKDAVYAYRFSINFENTVLHYYYNFDKSSNPVFLEMMELNPTDTNVLKYNLHLGMNLEEILQFMGNNYWKKQYSNNYEICYEGDGVQTSAQVNFLFNEKDILIGIIIHEYLG